jgi:hypothetical protein
VLDDHAEGGRFTRSLHGDSRLRVQPIDRILTVQIAQIAVEDGVR